MNTKRSLFEMRTACWRTGAPSCGRRIAVLAAAWLALGLAIGRAAEASETQAVEPVPAEAVATSPEVHVQGKQVFNFTADALELKSALALFARANQLNIVPDNDVSGTVTLDVRGLPLDQMMRALLEANDCCWEEEDGLIRVHTTETRIFTVDYLRLIRKGQGQSSAMLAAGSTSSGGM
ncbi:MAG TPA: hypothetical protein PKM73_21045, partial [Verrucomicrobiota bacterium]|nr:hypothetical protein [Verrucomicrobiota bacterium]